MGQITNKKELVASFAEPTLQGFDPNGRMITYTLFSELDYARAEAISVEIYDNIIDYLAEHHVHKRDVIIVEIEMNLPSFARACLRNVELSSQLEILHATLQIGYMFSLTCERLNKLREGTIPPDFPNIKDN